MFTSIMIERLEAQRNLLTLWAWNAPKWHQRTRIMAALTALRDREIAQRLFPLSSY